MYSVKKLYESKDLKVYKKMIDVFTQWTERFPLTGMESYLSLLVDKGKSVVPKEEAALKILDYIFSKPSFSEAVDCFLNCRFSDLPVEVRPLYKAGRSTKVAFWNINGKLYDRVKSLLSEEQGFFSDLEGNKVQLLQIEIGD